MKKYNSNEYYFGVGRRKTSSSRVYLKKGSGNIQVNGVSFADYFYGNLNFGYLIKKPLQIFDKEDYYDIFVTTKGGGFTGQMEATKLAISRALLEIDPDCKSALKNFSLLTRDPRSKERKKYGLKAARKATQFSKR